MGKTREQIAASIAAGEASLGIEYGSTRIKAVLVDAENEPIAVGAFDWENSLVDGYWTYSEEEIFAGLRAAYASLKADVAEKYGVMLSKLAALGISAMMHGDPPFDAEGNLLVPFRTGATPRRPRRPTSCPSSSASIPRSAGAFLISQPGCFLNGEEHVPQIDFFTTLSGFAHWKLTGEKVLSIGDASGMFPIDSTTHDYDADMVAKFDELVASKGVAWKVEDRLPRILVAGDVAGHLTPEGAALSRSRRRPRARLPGLPARGRRGDRHDRHERGRAAHGQRVGRHLRVLHRLVLDHALKDATSPEIDIVTTPMGDPVAMVHCNNCTSDINGWVGLLCDFAELMGPILTAVRSSPSSSSPRSPATRTPVASSQSRSSPARPLWASRPGTRS